MGRAKTFFACQSCGTQAAKWLGRCPDCGEWNSFVEETTQPATGDRRRLTPRETTNKPIPLPQIDPTTGAHAPIGLPELDRVLGGGLVPGSMTLLGGDPGIGKSTIVLQALATLSAKGKTTLYVTGEESGGQVRLRANRLGLDESEKLHVFTENSIDAILAAIDQLQPHACVIDSIQTVYSSSITSAPGTVSQLREATAQLLYATKSRTLSTILIGHVTKDGAIAGPKVLEHMVDTVLYFEGERGHNFRILRAVKNRFGSTNEIGVFEMTGQGLQQVANPSALFLSERPENAAGSVVVVPLEGTRPVLVELQALVSHSGLANPRRNVIGVETGRVGLLVAVLEKIHGLELGGHDIFVNVAGGLKIREPAVDLGIITAIASSFRNRPIDAKTVLIGEVGLTGEVRAVAGLDNRLAEAKKLGFTHAIVPETQSRLKAPKGMELYGVASVEAALSLALSI